MKSKKFNGGPFWMLESNKVVGYKVVFCYDKSTPHGGEDNGNYVVIADGLRRWEAEDMIRRLQKS